LLSELKLEDSGVENPACAYTYSQVKPVRDEIHTQAKQIRSADKDEALDPGPKADDEIGERADPTSG
jgi:hypothetical protein